MACVADHDVLAAAFEQVKSATTHLTQEIVATDFTVDIADRTSDHAAALRRFGGEDQRAPGWIRDVGRKHLHPTSLAETGKEILKKFREHPALS